jgi:hypothetical protein
MGKEPPVPIVWALRRSGRGGEEKDDFPCRESKLNMVRILVRANIKYIN